MSKFIKKYNDLGMTLIEIMIAMMIFSIGLAGVMAVHIKSRYMAKHTDQYYTAYNLAKNHLESLRSLAFADAAYGTETSVKINDDGVPDEDGNYERTTTVAANYKGNASLTQITVQVLYKTAGKQLASPISLSTVIYSGN